MSESLKCGKGGGPGNSSVFCYPDRWVWAKDSVDILAAYKKKKDFFHVLWQVNKPGQVDLRVESPSHNVDRSLNDIKCDVIAALSSKLPSKMSEKGYDYKIGGAISKRRNDRSTKVFRVLLAHHRLKPTSKENIQTVHDALGSTVEAVLLPFNERLEAHFRRLRSDQVQ